MSVLGQRVLAALVLIPITVVAVLWLPTAGFAAVLAVVALLGAREWGAVGALPAPWHAPFVAAVGLGMGGGYALMAQPVAVGAFIAIALLWWLVALLWVIVYQRGEELAALERPVVRALAGWLIITPTWLSLVWLHARAPALVMYLLVLIWVADSVAYFAGRRFGRRRLASRVSPGKSWEGVVGGLAGVACLALATAALAQAPIRAWGGGAAGFVVLSLVVACGSVLGDLCESLFKRRARLKDSGGLIPGHGGVLDRIDSLTAAGPCFAAGWVLAGGAP